MSSFIDIHVINSLGPNNINRDENNKCKTVQYGGVTRQRVSSQAIKYGVRGAFIENFGDEMVSLRSRSTPALVVDALIEADPTLAVSDARQLAGLAFGIITGKYSDAVTAIKKSTDKGDEYLPVLKATFQVSPDQAKTLASEILSVQSAGKQLAAADTAKDADVKKRFTEAVREACTADVVLFGRMMADNTSLNVDACCQVAHGIGVSPYGGDVDMYIAADEYLTRDTDTTKRLRDRGGVAAGGADMLDSKTLNAGSLYRYANLNVDALVAAVGSAEEASVIIERFIDAFARTLPSGAQNSHAATSPVSTLVVAVRTSPKSLVEAFETPVDTAAQAAKSLASYAARSAKVYGESVGDHVFAATVYDQDYLVREIGADENTGDVASIVAAVGAVVRGR